MEAAISGESIDPFLVLFDCKNTADPAWGRLLATTACSVRHPAVLYAHTCDSCTRRFPCPVQFPQAVGETCTGVTNINRELDVFLPIFINRQQNPRYHAIWRAACERLVPEPRA